VNALNALMLAHAKPLLDDSELASLPFGRVVRHCVRRRLAQQLHYSSTSQLGARENERWTGQVSVSGGSGGSLK